MEFYVSQKVKCVFREGYGTFRFSSPYRNGFKGKIKEYDFSDDTYCVEFENDFAWFLPSELKAIETNVDMTVEEAIDFLVSKGFKVSKG
ncbi:MAG TPA: hypothetical protein VFM18_04025 [Methanosarcina sp.]|nr:hypothetical protein [Methanosarcina sp.]